VDPVATNTTAAGECKLGVQLYSFRNDLDGDLPGTLARVKKLGLDCIEPYSLHGLTPEALRAEFDRAGLQVVSFHLPRELFVGPPQDAVNVGKVLGARQIGVAWIKESENDVVDEAKLMAAADRLNAMCEAAQAADMQVFYHTHGYEFHEGDDDGRLFDRFVNALQPECVVLQLDAYWVAYAGQDPVELLRRYADRTLSLHLKDMAPSFPVAPFDGSQWQGPLPDEAFAVIGQGKLDWASLLQVADEAAVQWYIIEDETTRPMENIAAAMPFLRSHGL
jgi:sugar phosphate isomerase/epimerase